MGSSPAPPVISAPSPKIRPSRFARTSFAPTSRTPRMSAFEKIGVVKPGLLQVGGEEVAVG